jgi:hypothetical protein
MTPREIDSAGHRALCVALIESALKELNAAGKASPAAAWIAGAPARVPFDVACDMAGVDPDALRSRLRRLAREAA